MHVTFNPSYTANNHEAPPRLDERLKKKWTIFNFPQELVDSAPDCVAFLLKSGMAYLMAMFQDTSIEPAILLGYNNEPLIQFEGERLAWNQIKQKICLHEGSVVSVRDHSVVYNYIWPSGFVQKDPFIKKLYPICTLSKQTRARLQNHAQNFFKDEGEVDPGQEKPCVLQLVSMTKQVIPKNFLTENFVNTFPEHTAVRLVDSTGDLYSFGIQVSKELERYAETSCCGFLATGYSHVVTPDYEESRPYDERFVTSIPITQKRFDAISDFTNAVAKSPGMRFCLTRQNCTSFTKHIAALAGLSIDCTMSVPGYLHALTPSFGKILGFAKVHTLVTRIFSSITFHKKLPVKVLMQGVRTIVLLPVTVSFTLFLRLFGAKEEVQIQKKGKHQLTNFSRHINSFSDYFRSETLLFDHSYKLTQWQKAHSLATEVFSYTGEPKLCILKNIL